MAGRKRPAIKEGFTPREVDDLKVEPGKSQTVYMDPHPKAPKGFGVRVRASGARSFVLLRTVRGGRRVWVTIGPAKGASLESARRAAEALIGEMAMGVDPNVKARETRAREREAAAQQAIDAGDWTVLLLVREYLKSRAASIQLGTYRDYERIIDGDIEKTPLGALRARHAVRDDVRAWLRPIAARAPSTAYQALALLRSAYRWAMDEEVVAVVGGREVRVPRVDRDPTRRLEHEFPAVRAAPRRKRKRHLSDAEIPVWWRRLDAAPRRMALFARLILLCGTRRAETHRTRRGAFDLDPLGEPLAAWEIPAKDRKGRAEGTPGERRALTVPLSPLAVRLLIENDIDELEDDERLFTFSEDRVGVVIREKTGIKVSIHDLRRSTASGLQRIGAPPHVISIVLGHAREEGSTQTDGAYTHDPRAQEHRLWLERWALHVEKLVSPQRTQDSP